MRTFLARALLVVLILVVFPKFANSQSVHFGLGLQSVGQLSNEITHYSRLGNAEGIDLYFAGGGDVKSLSRRTSLTAKVVVLPTWLNIWRCDTVPCRPLPRWKYRPSQTNISRDRWHHSETVILTTASLGLRHALVSDGALHVDIAEGAGLTILSQCRHALWGACPMASASLFAEAHTHWHGVGIEGGVAVTIPRNGRFTAIDDQTGARAVDTESQWIISPFVGGSIAIGKERK